MKYLHKFNTQDSRDTIYGDAGSIGGNVESYVASGVTFVYNGLSYSNHRWVDPNGEYPPVDLSVRNPLPGLEVNVGNDLAPIESITREGSPSESNYSEPWVSWTVQGDAVDYNRGPKPVDLGLPSGLLWADCNLGARFETEFGDYYAWGETSTKSAYTWDNYIYAEGNDHILTKYNAEDGLLELESMDDAVATIMGGGWRMPTLSECEELVNYQNTDRCSYTINGIDGTKITSRENGEYIFFPQGGSKENGPAMFVSSFGRYWTKTLDTYNNGYEHPIMFGWCHADYPAAMVHHDSCTRQLGCLIRPVKEPYGYRLPRTNFA